MTKILCRDFKQGTEFGLIMEFWGCPGFMKTKPPKQSPEKKNGQEALAAIAAWHNAKQQVEPSIFRENGEISHPSNIQFPQKPLRSANGPPKWVYYSLKMSEHVV